MEDRTRGTKPMSTPADTLYSIAKDVVDSTLQPGQLMSKPMTTTNWKNAAYLFLATILVALAGMWYIFH